MSAFSECLKLNNNKIPNIHIYIHKCMHRNICLSPCIHTYECIKYLEKV